MVTICDNYQLAVPFRLAVIHSGYEGEWMLASLGDLRGTDGQVTTILTLQGMGRVYPDLLFNDQDVDIQQRVKGN